MGKNSIEDAEEVMRIDRVQYFIKRGEKVQGPFSREQLVEFAKAQKFTGSDRVGSSANGPFQELKAVWASINEPADQQIQPDNIVSSNPIGAQPLPATDYYSQQIKEGGKKPVKKKKKQNTWDAMAGWIEKNKIMFNVVIGGLVVLSVFGVFYFYHVYSSGVSVEVSQLLTPSKPNNFQGMKTSGSLKLTPEEKKQEIERIKSSAVIKIGSISTAEQLKIFKAAMGKSQFEPDLNTRHRIAKSVDQQMKTFALDNQSLKKIGNLLGQIAE